MEYFQKLKATSPSLYHICLLVIGVSSALAIYKSIGVDHSYQELLGFIGFGIFLFCIATLLKFIMKNEVRSIVFSALIVTGAIGWYAYKNIDSVFVKHLGPSVRTQSTWCNSFPMFCSSVKPDNSTPSDPVDVSVGTKPNGKNIVFFQFAGDLNRINDIKPFLKRLSSEGWNGQGFDRGGERTKAAIGYNEVRYFYSEDKENAQRLANAIKSSKPPKGTGKGLKIQRLRAEDYNSPAKGTLGVWVSN